MHGVIFITAPMDGLWIAVAALVVSVVGAFYNRRQARTNEHSDARTEARDLADIRGQVIDDLEARFEELESDLKREREQHAEKIELLEKVIAEIRREAAEAQRILLVGFRGTLLKLLGHLETDPPEVDHAIDYLREMLNDETNPPSRRRRRASA